MDGLHYGEAEQRVPDHRHAVPETEKAKEGGDELFIRRLAELPDVHFQQQLTERAAALGLNKEEAVRSAYDTLPEEEKRQLAMAHMAYLSPGGEKDTVAELIATRLFGTIH